MGFGIGLSTTGTHRGQVKMGVESVRKLILWLFLLILSVGAGWFGVKFWRMVQLDKHFDLITANDTEEKVFHLLGKPTTIVYAGEEKDGYWIKDKKHSKEFQYFSQLPYVNPEILVIGFDENGRV